MALRAYVKTAAMSAADVGENPLFLMDFALRLLRVLVLLALWRTLFAGRETPGVMPLATVLTYTVVAEVFSQQLAVSTTLSVAFWEGTLVLRFLRPMGLVRQFAAEMSGRWALHFALFSVPLVVAAPLLGVDPRPASPAAGALFVISLCLAVLVGLAIEVLFGAITVALEQPVWLVERARVAIATLLSGSLLPLALYPWGIGDVFSWLPFAAMAWAPLAIYTGTGQPLPRLGSQVLWAVVLWPLADWLWRANREKLVGYGG
ncbi:MAG TPA: ABC-2 family transporter protein [Chloroflexota bacterium]|nr:ABC-2 family transporter protein [Chloroflexota bacterium]